MKFIPDANNIWLDPHSKRNEIICFQKYLGYKRFCKVPASYESPKKE